MAQNHLLKVLITDDHRMFRQGLRSMLQSNPDIKVIGEAENGHQALEVVRRSRPDIVLMDVSMPEMDGIEATRRIKHEMPDVRIICLSMNDDGFITRTMREAGAELFVSKEATATELLKAIYGITGRRPEDTSPDRGDPSTQAAGLSPQEEAARRQPPPAAQADTRREDELGPEPNRTAHPPVSRLIHDLRVHQIELAKQNEELRRTQEELEASRESYFNLFNLAPVAYFSISPSGSIIEANLTAADMLGVLRSDLVGRPLLPFVLPEDQEIFSAQQRQLFLTGAPQVCELRFKGSDDLIWCRLEATVVRDGPGQAPLCRLVASDISAHKRADEQRQAVERSLAEAQRHESLTTMAGAIAHNFNNKLASVVGNLELALDFLTRNHQAFHLVKEAEQSAWGAAEISTLMLKYVGQGKRSVETLDLAALARELLPMVRAALPEGVQLETDLPPGLHTVNLDTADFRQLLINLVTNAREAIDSPGGIVYVAMSEVSEKDTAGTETVAGEKGGTGPWVCLEIRDTGSGMDQETLNRMFDPFFSTKFIGRGLGLAVCLGIVRAGNGEIVVESKPRHGTRVRVFFPISDPPGEDGEQSSATQHREAISI